MIFMQQLIMDWLGIGCFCLRCCSHVLLLIAACAFIIGISDLVSRLHLISISIGFKRFAGTRTLPTNTPSINHDFGFFLRN